MVRILYQIYKKFFNYIKNTFFYKKHEYIDVELGLCTKFN